MLFGRDNKLHAAGSIIAAVDIGSAKICCLIAAVAPEEPLAGSNGGMRLLVLGLGHQRALGIEGGAVSDAKAATPAIRSAISQAEQMARIELDSVYVGVSCGRPRSRTFHSHKELPAGMVERADLDALESGARVYAQRGGGKLIQLEQTGYRLDGVTGVREPLGMAATSLHAEHHAVLVDEGPLRNLALLVESCHLDVAGLIPTAYASAIAVATPEEQSLGVTCIDIGAGVTSIAAFARGHLVFTATLPVGGQQITDDIAAALSVPLAEAERIKSLYATLAPGACDEGLYSAFPFAHQTGAGLDGSSRVLVARIVRQRMTGVLREAAAQLEQSGVGWLAGKRVVLTGGASQVPGLADFAAEALGQDVRVARPSSVRGWVSGQPGPAFSCLIGLVKAGATWPSPILDELGGEPQGAGYLGRMERWLRESF
ncbi:MAG: cell division protein FtsA [Hyphomicrobiaceae bacterium]